LKNKPFISTIIPVLNSRDFLRRCLESLKKSTYKSFETIVVDDASSDNIVDADLDEDINYFRLDKRSGPAAARNFGASKAKGEILMFLDSDILVKPDTLSKIVSRFKEYPDISAVFGSYNDEPYEKNFISQYKNLIHHHIHQESASEAVTFWAGCGAIKKEVFNKVGGFNEEKYRIPSIEDIELGYRLSEKKNKIFLDKDIQVTHLKKWEWGSLLKTDIINRAVPWSLLILESNFLPKDLNLKINERISAFLVLLLFILILFYIFDNFFQTNILQLRQFCLFILVNLAALFILNRKLYSFFYTKKGLVFTLGSIFMHFLYYLYSIISFLSLWTLYKLWKILS